MDKDFIEKMDEVIKNRIEERIGYLQKAIPMLLQQAIDDERKNHEKNK